MVAETKNFGTIDISEDKVITFPRGIMGFEQLKQFAIIFDSDKGDNSKIMWLQSMDEPAFAMPVIDPLMVTDGYNPMVEDELLTEIGECNGDNILALVTLTVTSDITKITANLKAPIVINTDTKKACQIVVENDEYEIKHPIYDYLKAKKGE